MQLSKDTSNGLWEISQNWAMLLRVCRVERGSHVRRVSSRVVHVPKSAYLFTKAEAEKKERESRKYFAYL